MTRCTSLRVDTGTRFSLLLYQFAKARQHEFAVLFDLFVGQGTECIKKHSSHPLVWLSGLGPALKARVAFGIRLF